MAGIFKINPQEIILKGASAMLDAKFKKDPSDKLKFSMSQIVDYMKKNYPQYEIKTDYSNNDLKIEMGLASVKKD
jgi:hypothetical protein